MLGAADLRAQGTASVEGVVKDTQGDLLTGVKVTLTNDKTGGVQGTITDVGGAYRFTSVSTAGSYSVAAAIDGFKKALVTDLVLRTNERRLINLELKQYTSDEIVVIGERAPLINRTTGEVSSYITEQQIETIPTDGRKISGQLYFVPGVTPATVGYPEAPNISINGQTSIFSSYLIDGFDNNERFLGGQKFDTPIGAAQNVAVLTNTYSAEFGRTSNGIVNITTKSGTNDLKGEVFYYLRPGAAIDVPNYFSPRTVSDAVINNGFNRNQAGFSVGGPIVRDQTFFFFNAEISRDNVDGFIRSPAAALEAVVPSPSYSSLFTAKLDHRWNDIHSTSLRGNLGLVGRGGRDGLGLVGFSTQGNATTMPSAGFIQTRPAVLAAIKHDWATSPTSFNETRLQYSSFRWNYGRAEDGGQPQVILRNADSTSVLGTVGNTSFVFDDLERTVQFANTYTQSLGRHTVKGGVDLLYSDFQLYGGTNQRGAYNVRLKNNADFKAYGRIFDLSDIPSNVTVDRYSVEAYSSAPFGVVQFMAALFVEDSFKLNERLTLNLGLRWDFDNLTKAGGKNFDLNNIAPRLSANYLLTPDGRSALRGGYGIFYERIVYAVTSDALQFTTQRAPYIAQLQILKDKGILPADADLLALTRNGDAQAIFAGANVPAYLQGKTQSQIDTALATSPAAEWRIQNPNGLTNPYSHQFSLGFQQQVTDDMAFAVDGVVLLGQDLVRLIDLNAPSPYETSAASKIGENGTPRTIADADLTRPAGVAIGGARQITMSETKGESRYYALMFNLKKILTNNYAFNIAYTLSWGLSNSDGINFRAQDNNDFSREWGYTFNDRRHVVALTGSYQFFTGTTLSLNALIQSGQAINRTVGRNNLELPAATPNDIREEERKKFGNYYGHGEQYGDGFSGNLDRYPGVERSSERLPATAQFDLSFAQRVSYERYGIEIRADVFNLFNVTNYSGYFGVAGETNRAQFGRPGDAINYRSAGPARQYQFSARVTF
ncbi:MAG: TonB-dependent receptor [Rhizobacter sp.]|nr:TonB-dependent receptor [Chlorobiales bacterium]